MGKCSRVSQSECGSFCSHSPCFWLNKTQWTMDFFQSIPISLHPKKSAENRFVSYVKRAIRRAAVLIIIATLIYGVLVGVLEEESFRALTSVALSELPNYIGLLLLAESYVHRHDLRKFTRQMEYTDAIMCQQLAIYMKYEAEKLRARKRYVRVRRFFVAAFIAQLFMFIIYNQQVHGSAGSSFYYSLCRTYRIQLPIILVNLYFYRIIMFIDIVRHRYRLVNECVYNFHVFTDLDYAGRPDEVRAFFNSDDSFARLHCVRRVCRLLYSASHSINDLFRWSLLICIFYVFVCLCVFGYLAIVVDSLPDLMLFFANHFLSSIYNIVALASACELTTQEVKKPAEHEAIRSHFWGRIRFQLAQRE